MPADPTYPLYPVVSFTCAALLLLTLTTNTVRQSWNLGVLFLCFWLFWETLFQGIDAVIWSNNADVKLPVYCDIGAYYSVIELLIAHINRLLVSHLEVFTSVVKPACTLIIARRLYKITSSLPIALPTRAEVRRSCYV
jgi:hypothetical protein